MDNAILFTVFTPTYNRAHTLERVYDCLCAQTWRDFEWLIVDDGSTDGTAEMIDVWRMERRLTLRYFRQNNSGKHVAMNRGVCEARGELFLPLDSDDTCEPTALDRLRALWHEIPAADRDRFSGLTCLCRNPSGAILGDPLPAPFIDGPPQEIIHRLRRRGEMWGFHRTSVMREFPFPEFAGERFVPEGLVWSRIGRKYQMRFVNEALRHYHESPDSLSSRMVEIRVNSPKATTLYYTEQMTFGLSLGSRFASAINLWRFALLAGRPRLASEALRRRPLLALAAAAAGAFAALRDRLRSSQIKRMRA